MIGNDWNLLAEVLGMDKYIATIELDINPTEVLIGIAETERKITDLDQLAGIFDTLCALIV